MHGEPVFNIAWCCQPHRMGHGQPCNLKWIWMDGWMEICRASLNHSSWQTRIPFIWHSQYLFSLVSHLYKIFMSLFSHFVMEKSMILSNKLTNNWEKLLSKFEIVLSKFSLLVIWSTCSMTTWNRDQQSKILQKWSHAYVELHMKKQFCLDGNFYWGWKITFWQLRFQCYKSSKKKLAWSWIHNGLKVICHHKFWSLTGLWLGNGLLPGEAIWRHRS